jgi:hypothetical protein
MTYKIFKISLIMLLLIVGTGYAQEWEESKQRHFIIYYKEAPEDFIKSVGEMAEQYYEEITRNLGFRRFKTWTWDSRAKIYIYNDAEDYLQSSKQARWSHGVASPKDKVIRTYPSDHGFFDSTLPHELGHIIFREFVGFEARIPIWFEEGVAMYQEKAKRWGAYRTVKKAIADGKFMSLDEMTHMRLSGKIHNEIVNLFYAESASIVYYMINELGQHRFVRFCRKLQEGGPFEWALESVYVRFKNIDKLNEAWLAYLGNEQ